MENRSLEITNTVSKRLSMLNHFEKILSSELDATAREQYQVFILKQKTELYKTLDSNPEESQILKALDTFEDNFYVDLLKLHQSIEEEKNIKTKKVMDANEVKREKENEVSKRILELERKVKKLVAQEAKSRPPEEAIKSTQIESQKKRRIKKKVGTISIPIEIKRTKEPPIETELNKPGRVALLYKNNISRNDVIEVYWLDKLGNKTHKTIKINEYLEKAAVCEITRMEGKPETLQSGQIAIVKTEIDSGETKPVTKVYWVESASKSTILQKREIDSPAADILELKLKEEGIIPKMGLPVGAILKYKTAEEDPDLRIIKPLLEPFEFLKFETRVSIKKEAEIAYWIDADDNIQEKILSDDKENLEKDLIAIEKSAALKLQDTKLVELKSQLNHLEGTEIDTPLTKIIESACQDELRTHGYLTEYKKNTPIDDVIAIIDEQKEVSMDKKEEFRNKIARISETISNENSVTSIINEDKLNKENISEALKNNQIAAQKNITKTKINNYQSKIDSLTIRKEKLVKEINNIRELDDLFDISPHNPEYINKLVDENYQTFYEAYQPQLPTPQQAQAPTSVFSLLSRAVFAPERPEEAARRIQLSNSALIKEHINYAYDKLLDGKPADNADLNALYISTEKIYGLDKFTVHYYSVFDKKFRPIPLSFFQTNVIQDTIRLERNKNQNYDINQLIPLITKFCNLTPESKCNYNEIKNQILIDKLTNLNDGIKEASDRQAIFDKQASDRQALLNKFKETNQSNFEKITEIKTFLKINKQAIAQKAEYYLKLREAPELKVRGEKLEKLIDNNWFLYELEVDKLLESNTHQSLDLEDGKITEKNALEEANKTEESLRILDHNAKKLLNDYDEEIKKYEERCDNKIKELREQKLVKKLEGKEFGVEEIFEKNKNKIKEIDELYKRITKSKSEYELMSNDEEIWNITAVLKEKKSELQNIKDKNIKLYEQITGKKVLPQESTELDLEQIAGTKASPQGTTISPIQEITKIDLLETVKTAKKREPNFEKLINLNQPIEDLKSYKEKKVYKRNEKLPSFKDYADKIQEANQKYKKRTLFRVYLRKLEDIKDEIAKFNKTIESKLKDDNHNILFAEAEKNKNHIRLDKATEALNPSITKITETIETVNQLVILDSIPLNDFKAIKDFCDVEIPALSKEISELSTIHNNILQIQTVKSISNALEKTKQARAIISSLQSKQENDSSSVVPAAAVFDKGAIIRIEHQLKMAKDTLSFGNSLPELDFQELQKAEESIINIQKNQSKIADKLRKDIDENKKSKIVEAEKLIKEITAEKETLDKSINAAKEKYSGYTPFSDEISNINSTINNISAKIAATKNNTNEDPLEDILSIENMMNGEIPKLSETISTLNKKHQHALHIAIVDSMIQALARQEVDNISNRTSLLSSSTDADYVRHVRNEKNINLSEETERISEAITTFKNKLNTIKSNLSVDKAFEFDQFQTDAGKEIEKIQKDIFKVTTDFSSTMKGYKQSKLTEANNHLLKISESVQQLQQIFNDKSSDQTDQTYLDSFSNKNKGITLENEIKAINLEIKRINEIISSEKEDVIKKLDLLTLADIKPIQDIINKDISDLYDKLLKVFTLDKNITQAKMVEQMLESLRQSKNNLNNLRPLLNHKAYLNENANLETDIQNNDEAIRKNEEQLKKIKETLTDANAVNVVEFDKFETDFQKVVPQIAKDISTLETKHINNIKKYKESRVKKAEQLIADINGKVKELDTTFDNAVIASTSSEDTQQYLDSFRKKNKNVALKDATTKIGSTLTNINQRLLATKKTVAESNIMEFNDIADLETIIASEIPALNDTLARLLNIKMNVWQTKTIESLQSSLDNEENANALARIRTSFVNDGYVNFLIKRKMDLKGDLDSINQEKEIAKQALKKIKIQLSNSAKIEVIPLEIFSTLTSDIRQKIEKIEGDTSTITNNHESMIKIYKNARLTEAEEFMRSIDEKAIELDNLFKSKKSDPTYLTAFGEINKSTLQETTDKFNSKKGKINEIILALKNNLVESSEILFDDITDLDKIIAYELPELSTELSRLSTIHHNVLQSKIVKSTIESLKAFENDANELRSLLELDDGEYQNYLTEHGIYFGYIEEIDKIEETIISIKNQFESANAILNPPENQDSSVKVLSRNKWEELISAQKEIDTLKTSIETLQFEHSKIMFGYDISKAKGKMLANITTKLEELEGLISSSTQKNTPKPPGLFFAINKADTFISDTKIKLNKIDLSDNPNPIQFINNFGKEIENQIKNLQQTIIDENRKFYIQYVQDRYAEAEKLYEQIDSIKLEWTDLKLDQKKLEKIRSASLNPLQDDSSILEDFKNKINVNGFIENFTDKNGLPNDNVSELETFIEDLRVTSPQLNHIGFINQYIDQRLDFYENNINKDLVSSLRREFIHHFLDTFDSTEPDKQMRILKQSGEENKYREIEKSYAFLSEIVGEIRKIENKYNTHILNVTDILKNIERTSTEKIELIEQRILQAYWNRRKNEGLFSDPVADKLQILINSPKLLNLPYTISEVCRATNHVSGSAPDIAAIKRIQNNFNTTIKTLFQSFGFKGYDQYMMTSNYFFNKNDRFSYFNLDNDLGKMNRARARIVIEDITKPEKLRGDNQSENAPRRDFKAFQEFINPAQMEQDRKDFPFTCAYQRLIIQLSNSHLDTKRRDAIIKPLMEEMEAIRRRKPRNELNQAKSMLSWINTAKKAISDQLAESKTGQFLSIFKIERQSNLGDVLEEFSANLKKEIDELKEIKVKKKQRTRPVERGWMHLISAGYQDDSVSLDKQPEQIVKDDGNRPSLRRTKEED